MELVEKTLNKIILESVRKVLAENNDYTEQYNENRENALAILANAEDLLYCYPKHSPIYNKIQKIKKLAQELVTMIQ